MLAISSISSSVSVGRNVDADERELPPRKVEQDERLAADADVRNDEEHDHQRVRHDAPARVERAVRRLRSNPPPRAVLVQRWQNAVVCDGNAHFSSTFTPCGALGFGGMAVRAATPRTP